MKLPNPLRKTTNLHLGKSFTSRECEECGEPLGDETLAEVTFKEDPVLTTPESDTHELIHASCFKKELHELA